MSMFERGGERTVEIAKPGEALSWNPLICGAFLARRPVR
jgi:hypothetical protein